MRQGTLSRTPLRGVSSLRYLTCFFFSSRRRHTRFDCDWSSDVCSSDLIAAALVRPPQLFDGPALGAAPADFGAAPADVPYPTAVHRPRYPPTGVGDAMRSEERRVGKEGRSRWSPYH